MHLHLDKHFECRSTSLSWSIVSCQVSTKNTGSSFVSSVLNNLASVKRYSEQITINVDFNKYKISVSKCISW